MSNFFRTRMNATKRFDPITKKFDEASRQTALKHQTLAEAKDILKTADSLQDPVNLRAVLYKERTRLNNQMNTNETLLVFARKKLAKLNYDLRVARGAAAKARIVYTEDIQERLKDYHNEGETILIPNIELGGVWHEALDRVYELEDEKRELKEYIEALESDYKASRDFFNSFKGQKRNAATIKAAAQSFYEQALKEYEYSKRARDSFFAQIKRLRDLKKVYATADLLNQECLKIGVIDFLQEYQASYPKAAQKWLYAIRYQSKVCPEDDYQTIHVYFGGDDGIPDGQRHGHVVIPILNDGRINPKVRCYFRAPGRKRTHFNTRK